MPSPHLDVHGGCVAAAEVAIHEDADAFLEHLDRFDAESSGT